MKAAPLTRAQFAAIARLRWQLFFHSLRTTRGTMELVSRTFMGMLIAFAGVGGAIGFGAGAWAFVSKGSPEGLALLLWPIFLFWQFFPVMATAFTESTDSSIFLRFPLRYRAYFLVLLVYGAFDIATALGSMWLLGTLIGIGIAHPELSLWAVVVLLLFAMVNVILARTIFTWIERWLAQRRSREILGIFFFLLVISFQFIGPLINHFGDSSRPQVTRLGQQLTPAQRILPPGLAAAAIAQFQPHPLESLGFLVLLGAYGAGLLSLLHVRLRAQYRGENLSETAARASSKPIKKSVRPGWKVSGLSGPVAGIFEKELRYLSRSSPMLFTLVMPLVMLMVFRFGGGSTGKSGGLLAHAPNFAFPTGAAYAVLVLTNLVYNNFGADGGGVQLLFALPIRFREVVVAKNLAHIAVLTLELSLVWLAVFFLYSPPKLDITVATIAGILFAVPVNLAAGNLLSLYAPKKIEFGTFGRQRAPQTTVLISFVVQFSVFGIAALILLFTPQHGGYWMATLILLLLAAVALAGYFAVLSRVDRIALSRRETLISELCRA
jgi:ABC-2 type transport system permease protein